MSTNLVDLVAGSKITLGKNSDTYNFTLQNKGAVYQQSDKIDFGANWACEYEVVMMTTLSGNAVAGNTFDAWIGYSDSAVSGTNNWASCGGLDGPYVGYSGYSDAVNDAAAAVFQLDRIGSLKVCAVGNKPQEGIVGSFTPRAEYGYLVVYNGTGVTTSNTASHHQIQLLPVNQRVEASA